MANNLKDASITLLYPKDPTLEVFGLAKADGIFEIKNISFNDVNKQNFTVQGFLGGGNGGGIGGGGGGRRSNN